MAGMGNRRCVGRTQGVRFFKEIISVFLALLLQKQECPLGGDVSSTVFLSLLQKQEYPLGGDVTILCPSGMHLGSDDGGSDTRN